MRAVRIAYRIVLALALVVLLVLIGIKEAPRVLASMSSPTPSTTLAAGAGSSTPAASASETPVPTISVPTVSIPPAGGGGGGGGGGAPKPTTTTAQRPAVTSLSAPDVACPFQPSDAPAATQVPSPSVTVQWSTTGGTKAWFGIQTSDAEANPYGSVDLSGSVTVNYPCTEATQLYTITVEGPGGKTSRSITVHNTGAVG
jgi:hypothetical protein